MREQAVSWARCVALLVLAAGCDFDIDLKTGGDAEIGFEDGVVDLEEFVVEGDRCAAATAGERSLEGLKVIDYRTSGLREADRASRKPPSSGVRTARTSGSCPGETAWRSPSTATSSDEAWYAVGGDGDLVTCAGSCGAGDGEACSGSYQVEVKPEEGVECSAYDPVEIRLSVASSGARRRIDEETACAPGHGRFRFVAARSWDRDDDGLVGAELVPVRVSGAGALTNAAWIRAVEPVATGGLDLRVIEVDRDFRPGEDDRLVDRGDLSRAVGGGLRVAEGVLSGYGPFVVEEAEEGALAELVVDMTWTCGEGGVAAVPPAPGRALSLADAGCGVDQELTLRAMDDHVRVELYGDPNYSLKIPAEVVDGALVFDHAHDRLRLAGALDDSGLRLDRAEWLGLPLCREGRVALRAR